jgi:hypothetical protein
MAVDSGCLVGIDLPRNRDLETNRFRPRPLAIQKSCPFLYRAKVLGRALLAVRTDPNRFWMLLSGNAEIAFPSTISTASLPTPTPATAAATSNTAATNGATPTAGQKRKA